MEFNTLTVVSPEMVESKGFSVRGGAVRVTAFGVMGADTITFKRVRYQSDQPDFKRQHCCLFRPTAPDIRSAIDYQIGECTPSLTSKRNSVIIPYAGDYIVVLNGTDSQDLTIMIEPVYGDVFDDKEKGIDPCVTCQSEEWETTGAERCNQHFIEIEEVNACGDVRWTKTEKRCGYYASVPLPISLDDGGCCGSMFMGYLFHPDETRDPDATVEIRDCDKLVGYAYPQAGDGHTLPIEDCDGEIVGWAVNNSATAPQMINC